MRTCVPAESSHTDLARDATPSTDRRGKQSVRLTRPHGSGKISMRPGGQPCAVGGELRTARLSSYSDTQEREQVPGDDMLPAFSR